jgi:hypothetical protein
MIGFRIRKSPVGTMIRRQSIDRLVASATSRPTEVRPLCPTLGESRSSNIDCDRYRPATFGTGTLKNLGGRLRNVFDPLGKIGVITADLGLTRDQTARIGDEIGNVHDRSIGETVVEVVVGKYVIRGTHQIASLKPRDNLFSDHTSGCARAYNIHVAREDFVDRHSSGAELRNSVDNAIRVDVRDKYICSRLAEKGDDEVPDVAKALDCDPEARQRDSLCRHCRSD